MFVNHRLVLAAGSLIILLVGNAAEVRGAGGPDTAAAQAEVEAAKARLRAAEADLERADQLEKRKAISKEEYERAVVAYQRARTELAARQKTLEDRKSIQVATPVEGIVVECLVKEGEKVKAGQLLVRLDDRLARLKVERAKAKMHIAEAEMQTAEATLREAQTRLDVAERLQRKHAITGEDVRAARLTYERSQAEVAAKRGVVKVAGVDVDQAKLHLEMHVIHSPINGTVRTIYQRPGEGVLKLKPVVSIHPGE